MPLDKRDPEAGDLGAQDGSAANLNVASSLDPPADIDLVTCPTAEFAAFCDGYRQGYRDGAAAELERREADDLLLHHEAARIVHTLARIPEHDELERRRRDYGRSA